MKSLQIDTIQFLTASLTYTYCIISRNSTHKSLPSLHVRQKLAAVKHASNTMLLQNATHMHTHTHTLGNITVQSVSNNESEHT